MKTGEQCPGTEEGKRQGVVRHILDRVVSGKAKSSRRAFTKDVMLIYKGEEDYSGISVMDWEFKSRSGRKGRRKVPIYYEQ